VKFRDRAIQAALPVRDEGFDTGLPAEKLGPRGYIGFLKNEERKKEAFVFTVTQTNAGDNSNESMCVDHGSGFV
jgi:hypothetical protein